MLDAFLSRTGLTNIRPGSPLLNILMAAAQSNVRNTKDTFDLLNSDSLDRAEGPGLDRRGESEDVIRNPESAASGLVTVTDSSITKITTKIYQGAPAPITGINYIYVSDGSGFVGGTNLYLGRGTSNYEGPIPYNTVDRFPNPVTGPYWKISLSQTTKKFHNLGETVTLAQGGDRQIAAGALVQTPQGNSVDSVRFSVLYDATIPDGEDTVTGIEVLAKNLGTIGNVAAKSVTEFVSAPFTGATVTNPLPFSNGLDIEGSDAYKERIRSARQARPQGTTLAINTAVQGLVAADENRRVTSSSIVSREGFPTTLYLDDGTGYEERVEGIAIDTLVDSAFGGEQYFRVSSDPAVAKAFVQTTVAAPWNIADASTLTVAVGGIPSIHIFAASDFRNNTNATAYEVASSINANPNITFSARTAASGTAVVVFAKSESDEDVQVMNVGTVNANEALLLPTVRVDTLNLYRNDRLLSKDGSVASLTSAPFSGWGTISGSSITLTVDVDSTGPATYTFVAQDFIDQQTGYTVLAQNSVDAWVKVINAKVPGLTAASVAGTIVLTSNHGVGARAYLSVTDPGPGASLVSQKVFSVSSSTGTDNDYTLNRNRGQIRLDVPLVAGDRLAAGSINTRPFLESSDISTTTLAADANIWLSVDGDAVLIHTGLNTSVPMAVDINQTYGWGNRVRFYATSGTPFLNVRAGDSIILWDSSLRTRMLGTFVVAQVDTNGSGIYLSLPNMRSPRYQHATVTMANDQILVTGGVGPNGVAPIDLVEIFDPINLIWTMAKPMNRARKNHYMVALTGGKVLVLGGTDSTGTPTNSCEVYDHNTNIWTETPVFPDDANGSYPVHFIAHAISGGVNDGKAYVTGGLTNQVSVNGGVYVNAYLYDPTTPAGTWTATTAPNTPRKFAAHSSNYDFSKIVLAGGLNSGNANLSGIEYYDAAAGTWTTSLPFLPGPPPYSNRVAVGLVPTLGPGNFPFDGSVLIVGTTPSVSAYVYQPNSDTGEDATGNLVSAYENLTVSYDHSNLVAVSNTGSRALWGPGNSLNFISQFEIGGLVGSPTYTWTPKAITPTNWYFQTTAPHGTGAVYIGGVNNSLASKDPQSASRLWAWDGPNLSLVDNNIAQASFNLDSVGAVVSRLQGPIQKITVPAGTNYDAGNISASVNGQVVGGGASAYHTNRIRINTNTFSAAGDIALLSADADGSKFNVDVTNAIQNTGNSLASVETGNRDYGNPAFHSSRILGSYLSDLEVHSSVTLPRQGAVVGLNNFNESPTITRLSNSYWSRGVIANNNYTFARGQRLSIREPVYFDPTDRCYAADPYSLASQDDLTLVVDQDAVTKRFFVPLYRKLRPTASNPMGVQGFLDQDAGGAVLKSAFGTDYDFNDYALFMSSRALTHVDGPGYTLNNKSLLWRYRRLGPDGDSFTIAYQNPTGPDAAVSVSANVRTGTLVNTVSVNLSGGSARTGAVIRPGTRIGVYSNIGADKTALFLGFTVGSAVDPYQLIFYTGRGVTPFTVGETVTGTSSTATGTVVLDVSTGSGTGYLIYTPTFDVFDNLETITGSTSFVTATTGLGPYRYVTLTLTLPTILATPLTDHGLQNGDQVYLNSNTIVGSSKVITVQDRTATTISFYDLEGTFGGTLTDAGTISFDGIGETNFTAVSGLTVGDFYRVGSSSGLPSDIKNITIRIGQFGNQYVAGKLFDNITNRTVPVWYTVLDPDSLSLFPIGSSSTASDIADAVAGLGDTCPVTATVLNGAGAGTIDKSTLDEGTVSSYPFAAGLNWIETATAPAGPLDYSFDLKVPAPANFTSGCDWGAEDVRLVPLRAKSLADWFNVIPVTGISSLCEVKVSDQASRLQLTSLTPGSVGSIQVQGGSGNSGAATLVGTAAAAGSTSVIMAQASEVQNMFAGNWVRIDNSLSMPKTVITSATTLTSIDTAGNFAIGVTPTFSLKLFIGNGSTTWRIERQGRFVCYSNSNQTPINNGVAEGDWVRIFPGIGTIQSANAGNFRVIRVENDGVFNSFWVENPNCIEEEATANIAFLTFDSLMPGDTITIGSPVWGAGNIGTWTVTSVGMSGGSELIDNTMFQVDISAKSTSAHGAVAALAGNSVFFQVREAAPTRLFKQIQTICPSGSDARYVDIKFNSSEGSTLVTESAGSVMTVLDKLEFPLDLIVGSDGYSHDIGLLGEANRVLYSDPSDPATYPGVVAADSNINISGPLVKRVQIGITLRIKTGISIQDIQDRVRSSVAGVVNATGVGQPIAISDIVNAARKVNGVVSVVITKPTYGTGHDLIPVQPFEKPLVLDLDKDIVVTFTGD